MADYKESSVSGKQWQRCRYIIIDNPHNGIPQVQFQEEQVTAAGNQVFTLPVGNIQFPFDPAAKIDLINPADGSSLGAQMSYRDLYVAIWSLYITKAKERDAANTKVV